MFIVMTRKKALLLIAMVAFLWSSGGILIKLVSWNPLALASIRSLIGAVFLLLAARGRRFNFSPLALAGALAYAATLITFVAATKLTTAANAILLQYTAPIYVALLAGWFLREHIKWKDWLAIAAVLAGMLFFFLDKLTLTGLSGNLLAIGSGLFFASLVLLLRKQKDGNPLQSIIMGNILVFLIGLPFCRSLYFSKGNIAGILALGIFQIAIPYLLYSIAIRHVRAFDAILVMTLEPVLNPIWVWLIIAEVPGPWSIIGGLIVITAILLHGFLSHRQK
ncbi:MAG: DMT family transporter [Chrysiogenales bacterium]